MPCCSKPKDFITFLHTNTLSSILSIKKYSLCPVLPFPCFPNEPEPISRDNQQDQSDKNHRSHYCYLNASLISDPENWIRGWQKTLPNNTKIFLYAAKRYFSVAMWFILS